MVSIRVIPASAVLILGACSQPESGPSRAEFDEVQTRLAELEVKIAQRADPVKAPEPVPAASAKPRMTYRLIGASVSGGEDLRYPNDQACEQARAALLASWRDDDERLRAQGVISVNRPTPTCLPI